MRRATLLWIALFSCLSVRAQQPDRPRITGIAGVRIHVSSVNTARAFYGKILEADVPCSWYERSFPFQGRPIPARQKPASLPGLFFAFNDQFVILDDSSSSKPDNFLQEIMLFTDDLAALTRYLRSNREPARHQAAAHLYRDLSRVRSGGPQNKLSGSAPKRVPA